MLQLYLFITISYALQVSISLCVARDNINPITNIYFHGYCRVMLLEAKLVPKLNIKSYGKYSWLSRVRQ